MNDSGAARPAYLVLEDGACFEGYAFGSETESYGEVVFNTAMTGYQEMLSDPSYGGQILVPTYPIQGNYGINADDFESRRIQVRAFVVREECRAPSHYRSTMTLHELLQSRGVPGLAGVDTRAITRHLRSRGVMMGAIVVGETPEAGLARLKTLPRYETGDYVREVSTSSLYLWGQGGQAAEAKRPRIVVVDAGLKYNILRCLDRLGCAVTAVPCTTSAEDILALHADGVVFSPGPGDPALLDYLTDTAKAVLGRRPVMGICLGHQVVARAFGARTFKLKFGHRGANHPVSDLATTRIYITSQNHGFAVDADGLRGGAEVSHVHLNDGTVEGLRHRDLPVLTIQYHSEASPGPWDNMYLFDRWLEMVKAAMKEGER